MCGISLCYVSDPVTAAATVSRMAATMIHRGPDALGTYVDPVTDTWAVGMGHNRLSIIDLTEHAAQPMISRDGRYALIYNGEVYNYREVERELGEADSPGRGAGDTAVVLAALIKWGTAALERFNGMWALVLYDRKEKTLLVSRDRFGKKPLYYYRDGRSFYIASEIKAVLSGTGSCFRINPRVAVPFLTRGLVDISDETLFEGVQQFPAASFQLLRLGGDSVIGSGTSRFWQHPVELGIEPERRTVSPGAIRELFIDSVQLRLRSDVPVGVLLSGGIDSSSILGAVAAERHAGDVTVLSVISDDPASSEEPFIDAMTEFVGCRPQKFNASTDPGSLLDDLSSACWYNDGPVSSFSSLAHRVLMQKAAATGVKVLLTGQGSDEQLGGYNKFLYFYLQGLLNERKYGSVVKTLAQFAVGSNTLFEFRLSEASRYIARRQPALRSFIAHQHQELDALDIGYSGSYARREWLDLSRTSLPALLHSEDRMSMSHSVEMRVPFLDYRLAELLARVHPSEKFAGGRTKSIFREAVTGLVPREIQYRRDKRGFNVPTDDWMRGQLRPRVAAMFGSDLMMEKAGLVDGSRLSSLFGTFAGGRGKLNGRQFFRAYSLEVFMRRFQESIAASPAS